MTPPSLPPKPIRMLCDAIPHRFAHGDADTLVSAIRQDSRLIEPGDAFVAVPGFAVDGHRFLADALDRGAAALVVQTDRTATWQPIVDRRPDAAIIVVDDSRAALPHLAAASCDFPARKLNVVGVTGTDGKSTTTYLTHAMLNASGRRCGLINGVEFHVGGEWRRNETGETTPEADLIQPLLTEMVAAGDTDVVIEVSSHALELHRVDQINAQVGVFTGLSDDHLDFHETRERYLAAKLKLFQSLDSHPSGRAVVRAEDDQLQAVVEAHRHPTTIVTATPGLESEVSVLAGSRDARGADVRIVTPAGALGARLLMPGDYNLGNAALAAGAAWTLGVGPVAMQTALNDLRPVPGRMQSIAAGQPFTVIVDAAATAPALELALQTLRPHVSGRLILVFGVAGERDPQRKSGMAAVAASLADHTIITNENPRSEDPVEMVEEIARHFDSSGGRSCDKRPDRRDAIERAVSLARTDDLVLIAGKGAEPTMIYADRIEPWDDRDVARSAINDLLHD